MGRFARPCLKCGQVTRDGSYCAEHRPVKIRTETPERKAIKRERYDSTYKKLAKHIRQTTEVCHLCGGGWRPDDPWEADHLFPGDPSRKYELAGAHRSCNQKRGDKKITGGEGYRLPPPREPQAG